MKTSTFSTDCLRAIRHLSKPMQDRIIADITRYQLTGELPDKLPPMRRALFISLILQLDPGADISHILEYDAETSRITDASETPEKDAVNESPEKTSKSDTTPVPDYIMPDIFKSNKSSISPTRAEKRRLMRAVM